MRRAIGGFLIAVAVIGTILMITMVSLPATAEYNRMFTSHITMAQDQATFDGIKTQINIIWAQMNESFAGDDFATTYNTPWYWDQNYDNSLAAQQDYFVQLVDRIDRYQSAYDKQVANSTQQTQLTDWYDTSIQNLRTEMDRAGGLDWAINGAWFLNKRPFVYWWTLPIYLAMGAIGLLGVGLVFMTED